MKQIACRCERFTDALRGGFIELLGDDHYLASVVSGGGGVQSTAYGPKIEFCPFCGAGLVKPGELPRATVVKK